MKRIRPGAAVAAGILIAGVTAGSFVVRPVLARWVWREFSAHLEHLFDARVTVESFDVGLFPSVHVEGKGLRLHRNGAPDAGPLIVIETFVVSTSLTRLWNGNVRSVVADGLTLSIPPDARLTLKRALSSGPAETDPGRTPRRRRPLTVDEIKTTAATLVIAPNDASGVPLVFHIPLARLNDFSTTDRARFEAKVLNPKPRGFIEATGHLGPWATGDPRKTHVDGAYTLKQADMSVFRGIGGTLDSTGAFDGTLDAIAVHGSTEMVDFSIETGGHPMPLVTTFRARVDGTNGNTYLDRVTAKLGSSPLEASGEIAAVPGGRGKTIRLDVKMESAQLEDLITLAVAARPSPMEGRLHLEARLELPPGDAPVVDSLTLNGRFTIGQGRFSSDNVQGKVDELSRKGRGRPEDTSIDSVLSAFSGSFALRGGVLRLQRLQFTVRGAQVRLAGTYGLRGERLDFTGELRLQARVSQTTTGFKSFLLRAIDPFFSRNGAGAVLPIKVGGTVASPTFGLNMFRGRKTGAVSVPSAPPSRDTPSRRPGS